jgi:hypothetical protein
VPHDVLSTTVSEAVAHALEVHRAELAELVEQRVEAEVERLASELVAEAVARRNGSDVADDEQAEELLRCTTCSRLRRLEEFGRDASRKSGYRSRCKSCRSEREYRPRARRARRENTSPAARDGERDVGEPRPVGRAAENGRTRPSVPDAGERVPSVEAWLVYARFATLEHGELVATPAGLAAGEAIHDPLAAFAS